MWYHPKKVSKIKTISVPIKISKTDFLHTKQFQDVGSSTSDEKSPLQKNEIHFPSKFHENECAPKKNSQYVPLSIFDEKGSQNTKNSPVSHEKCSHKKRKILYTPKIPGTSKNSSLQKMEKKVSIDPVQLFYFDFTINIISS